MQIITTPANEKSLTWAREKKFFLINRTPKLGRRNLFAVILPFISYVNPTFELDWEDILGSWKTFKTRELAIKYIESTKRPERVDFIHNTQHKNG